MQKLQISDMSQRYKGRKNGARHRIGRWALYSFLAMMALFFLVPLYIMIITSLKSMPEIRNGSLFSWPEMIDLTAWSKAWFSACTGLECRGIQVGFLNSLQITIPSVFLSIAIGALNGYALTFWHVKGARLIFAILLIGAFIPYQVFLYPLIRLFAYSHLYGSLVGIILVHIIFGMPLMTLLFRNYYISLPQELFKAARIDGAGFWRIFYQIILPMSLPMLIVAAIMQVTAIWNDFLLGLVFAGRENLPMTVQLNNIVNTSTGERAYNVNMAATILTSLVPLFIYCISGRWFVRGIASGAMKGV